MRSLILSVLILIAGQFGITQQTVRQIDFKNFSYPLSGPTLGHDRLKWLDLSSARRIRLRNGKQAKGSPGFTLASVSFGDVTGGGQDDAIVVLNYDTGGTQETDYVYIYTVGVGQPKLLAYFYTGDRAYSGLYKVYGQSGKLVVELFDPEKRSGDCCSSGIVRTRYQWQNGHFDLVGARQRENIAR